VFIRHGLFYKIFADTPADKILTFISRIVTRDKSEDLAGFIASIPSAATI
jgi:hypothetical protein